MIPVDTALAFFTACSLLALAPGPDNLFVLTQSIAHGRYAGWFATLGFASGCLVHTVVVTCGIAALLKSSPTAFNAIKFAGAAYLLVLAMQTFLRLRSSEKAPTRPVYTKAQFYRRGIIMNVTNPKVTLFFLALLPQFTDPARGPVYIQLLMLGGIFVLCTLIVFGSIAWLAGSIQRGMVRRPRTERALHVLAGLVYLGLAARIASAPL